MACSAVGWTSASARFAALAPARETGATFLVGAVFAVFAVFEAVGRLTAFARVVFRGRFGVARLRLAQ